MGVFARGLEVAHALGEDSVLEGFVKDRYACYEEGIGRDIVLAKVNLETLADYAPDNDGLISTRAAKNSSRRYSTDTFSRLDRLGACEIDRSPDEVTAVDDD